MILIKTIKIYESEEMKESVDLNILKNFFDIIKVDYNIINMQNQIAFG